MPVNFYLDKRTDKKGDAPIRVSIVIKGARYLSSTGLKIAPHKWDADKQQVRRGSSNAAGVTWAVINSALARITEHLTAYENDCILNNASPDVDTLKTEYARVFGRKHTTPATPEKESKKRAPGFWGYYKMFIQERSATNQWTLATHQKFDALKSHLSGWRTHVSFDDFTDAGFASFIAYLRDVKSR